MTNGFVPVESGELYYETAGQGQALTFIHAGVADSRMWDEQFEFFSQYYQVIRYDTRGFGKTRTFGTPSFSNRQDLYDLLKQLGIEKTYLVGLSRGGEIALDFTLEHPEIIAALVPVAAGLSGFDDLDMSELPAYELQKFEELEKLEESGDFEKAAALSADLWVDGLQRTPGTVDRRIRDKVYEMTLLGYKRDDGKGQPQPLQPPAAGRLDELKVPTLIIVGDIDETPTMKMAEAMERGIAGAKRVVFPGVAHMVNMEKPEEFNRVLLGFLQGLK